MSGLPHTQYKEFKSDRGETDPMQMMVYRDEFLEGDLKKAAMVVDGVPDKPPNITRPNDANSKVLNLQVECIAQLLKGIQEGGILPSKDSHL